MKTGFNRKYGHYLKNRLTSSKERLMDPSEGQPYVGPSDPQELPPLYESVNSKDTEDKSSHCLQINRSLLPFKAFYHFFYGAIGSLFPFLALYYKHLWLSAGQAGLLVGLRPMIQSITVPFWALFADRFNAKKIILFIGLCGWLFTHISILLVPSGKKPLSCYEDSTHARKRSSEFSYSLHNDNAAKERNRNPHDILGYNHAANMKLLDHLNSNNQARFSRQPFEHFNTEDFPKPLGNSLNVSSSIERKATSQPNISELVSSNITAMTNDNGKDSWWTMSSNREPLDTWRTFLYIFLITLIGNMFSAPAQTMANMATLEALNGETHKYGAERCFGSIGWGVSAFVVGMLVSLNHDSSLACKGLDDINYTPCFYAFGAMMLVSLVIATFFKFRNVNDAYRREKPAPLIQVCKLLDYLTLFVFFTTFLAGFNMGFIQTFLFWHLQTLGGSQRLFSLITAFNAVGEMIGFLLSVKLISKYGHLKVLALGIFAYAVRLTVYGVIQKPWYVLTVEILKAFTSSAVWASVMSYIGAEGEFGATMLGIVHMLYWGVGYGGGGWLGGVLMEAVGARMTFLGLAVISLTVVILILVFIHLDCCPKKKRDIYMPLDGEDEDEDVEQDSE